MENNCRCNLPNISLRAAVGAVGTRLLPRGATRTRAVGEDPEAAPLVSVGGGPAVSFGEGDRPPVPLWPTNFASFAQQIGIGATVAFGGLVFAISFATLVFSGPDAPEGALAAGTGLIMVSAGASLFPLRVPSHACRTPPSHTVPAHTRRVLLPGLATRSLLSSEH